MIIALYQCDPGFRLMEEYRALMGSMELDRRGIDTSGLFVQGNIFLNLQKEGSEDTYFPRVGFEWTDDSPAPANISNNYRLGRLDDTIRNQIASYLARGALIVSPEATGDTAYEQVSHRIIEDFLNYDGYIESYHRHVESIVSLSGWATGNDAPKTREWLYLAIDSLYGFVVSRMANKFGVEVHQEGAAQLNLYHDGTGAHGFLLNLHVRQQRFVISHRPDYEPPKKSNFSLDPGSPFCFVGGEE